MSAIGHTEISSVHVCAHCDKGLAVVPASETNWAGLLCVNEQCVTVENRRLREALNNCRGFLTDPRISTWKYIESSDFYSDLHEVVDEINKVLPIQQQQTT